MSIIGEMYDEWMHDLAKKKDAEIAILKKERDAYRDVLMRLHLYKWTCNNAKFSELLHRIGAWSYSQTNGWEGMSQEEEDALVDLRFKHMTENL